MKETQALVAQLVLLVTAGHVRGRVFFFSRRVSRKSSVAKTLFLMRAFCFQTENQFKKEKEKEPSKVMMLNTFGRRRPYPYGRDMCFRVG